MTTCCFFLSVRTGCLLGASVFIAIGVIKVTMLMLFPHSEGISTILGLNVVLLLLAGLILWVGVVKEDRICIITFIAFDVCAMAIQAVGVLILHFTSPEQKWPSALVVILILEYIPCIYMVPIGVIEYRIVKEKHLRVAETYGTTRRVHNQSILPYAVQVPGLGF